MLAGQHLRLAGTIRLATTDEKSLSGIMIGRVPFALYGDQQLCADHASISTLGWVADDHTIAHTTLSQWQNDSFKDAQINARANNMMTKFSLIKNGVGIGFLPQILGAHEGNLIQLDAHKDWALNLWYLSHPDLSRMPRIKAFHRTLKMQFTEIFE